MKIKDFNLLFAKSDFAKFLVQVFMRKKTNNCFSKKILQFL